MDTKRRLIKLALILLLSIGVLIPRNLAENGSGSVTEQISLTPKKDWVIAGGASAKIDVIGEPNTAYAMSIFFPNATLFRNTPFTTDSQGKFLFTQVTVANTPVGTYTFKCEGTTTWITVINGQGYIEVPSPATKT